MLQYIEISGLYINTYKLFFYLALATVPAMLFLLRKKFGYTRSKALLYSSITLGFGLFAAWLTAVLKRVMLSYASGGTYTDTEPLRNYGIPIFLPVLLLIYCLVFRDDFKKVSDYVAPCVYSVMTFVKVGCLFWGCCYGEPSEHGIWNSMLGYRTFPVQLYDAITSLIITAICLVMIYRRGKKNYGYVYPTGGILFALTKGFWENFRVHESEYERNFLDTGWTLWQYWLLILFIGCILWIVSNRIRDRRSATGK